MLNKEGERELAYIVSINDIQPIKGADRVELAIVNGWTVMVKKGQFKPNDLAVYFEIDSKVPETETFSFLARNHYKIKTQKYFKGTVISQGLLMSAKDFGWETVIDVNSENKPLSIGNHHLGDFVTKELGVTYSVPEDNARKAKPVDKYKKLASRHPKLFKFRIIREIYNTYIGKRLLFLLLGNKRDKVKNWPKWVKKTDEERVQNMPWILSDKSEWIATEKIDGTSTTFTMRRGKKKLFRKSKNEFFVCSRNIVFNAPDKKCFFDTNVYLEMAVKYNVEQALSDILENNPEEEWVTIQGETYGDGIQKRNYNIKDHRFAAFNLITSTKGRWNSIEASEYISKYKIPFVPIIDEHFILPDTVKELLNIATDKSFYDDNLREGLVLRSKDGTKSFKAVSNEFLLKYHG